MSRCINTNPSKPDFRNPTSVVNSLLNLFKLPTNISLPIPSPTVLASAGRPGLSPSKIAARIIQRQSDAGIPVGPLPSGEISPDEIMERIRVEEIVNAIVTEMRIDVAIQPGTAITGSGANAGGPVQVVGTMVGIGQGNGMAL